MRKRPRDLNQWAKHMVDLATGNAQEPPPSPSNKNSAAAPQWRPASASAFGKLVILLRCWKLGKLSINGALRLRFI